MATVYANQSACKTPFRSVLDELLFYSSPKRMSSYIRLEIMLWILCLLQSMFHMTCGCIAEERIALMHVRSSLVKANSEAPDSWGQSDDCCSWERVTCDGKVARVSGLDLTNTFAALGNSSAESECWNLNLAVFSPLHELQVLDLSGNYACLHNLDGLQGLTKLRYLNLSYNNVIGNDTMGSLGKLASLEVINLFRSNISGTIPNTAFKNLKNMRELHLRSNQLSGSIPSSLFELPRLEYLDLSENLFQGHIPMSSFANISSSLRALKLPGNNLNGAFHFFWLRNCTMLKKIDLSGNSDLSIDVKFHGLVPPFQLTSLKLSGCNIDDSIIVGPNFLGTQRHLRVLDLSHNNLTGTIPSWIFTNIATLVYLNIANNSLVGSIDPMWQHQSALQIINISSNHLVGQLPTNSGSLFPNLTVLDASNNIISGYLPPSLCNISSMIIIDLSNNKFTGEVPTCLFTDFYGLNILKLSNNNLGGTIFGGVSKLSVMTIYLDSNKFEGTLPSNLSGNLLIMDLHDNKLSGKLDASLSGLSSLLVLSVASNNLTGNISPAICKLSDLQILDMSDNSFVGSTPNCVDKLPLYLLNMSRNSLSSFSNGFMDSSHITVLDLRYNQLVGSLHWTHHLSQIKLLLLGGNRFQGQISPSICHLQYLNIIDLSDNKISGSLPPCIGGISFGYHAYDLDLNTLLDLVYFSTGFSEIDDDDPSPMYGTSYGLQGFTFSTKGNLYTYSRNFFNLMFGIDLSGNMLSGEIPWEIGNLSYVKSLNLSNNFFSGQIPSTLANMSSMESLDLSHNELNGPIPLQLSRLWSLEVFSVAYNNLSGCIPVSGQLSSFSMDSYVGNQNLQNKSLGNACSADSGRAASPTPTEGVDDTPDDPIPIIYVVSASFVLAFWTAIAFSFFHPYGRSVMLKL